MNIVNGIRVPDGSSISIINNVVYINGVKYEGDAIKDNRLKLEVEGNLSSLEVKDCDTVMINGNINGHVNVDGSATIDGDITGDAKIAGSFQGGNIGGNMKVGGSANCGNVGGSVNAGGSLNCRKSQ